ncbi:MAG: rRNA maturation RNAse YbeY [Patescibacteria group bacterium]
MKQSRVVVVVGDKRAAQYAKAVQAAAERLLVLSGKREGSFFIYLVGSKFMNKNVLSFPHTKGTPRPDMPGEFLGEVYINPFYIKRAGESLLTMVIHGFLHLLGYDHVRTHDRIVMEQKEKIFEERLKESQFQNL